MVFWKPKYYIISIFLFVSILSHAQYSTAVIDSIANNAPYFNSNKQDTLLIIAQKLDKFKLPRAKAISHRLKGFANDYSFQPDLALDHYLKFYAIAKEYENSDDQLSAISDIVYTYVSTNQHSKAKPFLIQFLNQKDLIKVNQKKLGVLYNNLGVIFKNEQKVDSAVWAYNKSLLIKETTNDKNGIANLRINLSSLYISEGNFKEAMRLSTLNIEFLRTTPNKKDLCLNLINLSGAYIGLKDFNNGQKSASQALDLSREIEAKDLQIKAIQALAECRASVGDFEGAFSYFVSSDSIKSQLINKETNKRIAELQEKYNSKQRELDNQLLSKELKLSENRRVFYTLGLFLLGSIIIIIAYSLYKNRQKNKLISEQNARLGHLNDEKNKLISIVSHDLSSPFSTIKVWINTIFYNSSERDIEEAKSMINKVADFGLNTIEQILQIDENELSRLVLIHVDISELLSELVNKFKPKAAEKGISLIVKVSQNQETIISDKNLLHRVLDNLLSNAIKYSNQGGKIWLRTFSENGSISFSIEDQGIGISKDDLTKIFTPYSVKDPRIDSKETSHGLGLSIVSRIAQELGGKILVESELSKGSIFTLKFPI